MSHQYAAWIVYALWASFAAPFVWHVMTTFGWEGLALKAALTTDVCLAVKCLGVCVGHIFAFGAVDNFRTSPSFWFIFVLLIVAEIACFGVVLADQPTRWLLGRPRTKWALYVAALLTLAQYGIPKGWL